MRKSGYFGVTWSESSNKWRATIVLSGRQCHLGVFESEEDAAWAYNRAAANAPGRRRRLNFADPPKLPAGLTAIPLPGGLWTIVDDIDALPLSVVPWSMSHGYVMRVDPWLGHVTMHRQIMGFPDCHVDHRDRNPLNNSRSNLRCATHGQNIINRGKLRGEFTSGFKGVSWHKQHRKWYAQASVGGKTRFLGLFRDEIEAAAAYDRAVAEMHGDFASPNGDVHGQSE